MKESKESDISFQKTLYLSNHNKARPATNKQSYIIIKETGENWNRQVVQPARNQTSSLFDVLVSDDQSPLLIKRISPRAKRSIKLREASKLDY